MDGIVGVMDPSYASKLLGYNQHTDNPDLHPNPFEQLPPIQIQTQMLWVDQIRAPRMHFDVSHARANMAVMNNDVISAGLWALASFDPALVHLAELRERFAGLKEDDRIRITLERLTSVYLEGQCSKLLEGTGTTKYDAAGMTERLPRADETALQIVDCTDDPLAMEIMAYAMYLGALTAHGNAPWNRFAAVMADCYHQRQPSLGSV